MVHAMKNYRSMAERWLWLGVAALAVAGLYALVPVAGRTPQLKALNIMQQLFDVALVVHVDLSVLIWSLAMLGLGLALVMEKRSAPVPAWPQAGFAAVAASTLLIAFSPLGAWVPVKSNYIPVLHNAMFLLALGLLMAGVLVMLLPPLLVHAKRSAWRQLDIIDFGWLAAGFVALLGLGGYALGGYLLPPGLPLVEHYEKLFWAGGHIMQFCYTLVAMVAWLMVLVALEKKLPSRRWIMVAYMLPVAGAVLSLGGFVAHPFDTGDFTYFQTRVMMEWGGIGPTFLALLVVVQLLRGAPMARAHRAYGASLVVSLALFFGGGVLGLMIAGQNVTIPAHYHGMIVGITQGLMGLAYVMLPRFGYGSIAHTRLAFWQPMIYGAGQFMHIGGLAYCGGYGILRKTAGGFEHLAPDIKVALGIFGLGGTLAIIGGILFVVAMGKAYAQGHKA